MYQKKWGYGIQFLTSTIEHSPTLWLWTSICSPILIMDVYKVGLQIAGDEWYPRHSTTMLHSEGSKLDVPALLVLRNKTCKHEKKQKTLTVITSCVKSPFHLINVKNLSSMPAPKMNRIPGPPPSKRRRHRKEATQSRQAHLCGANRSGRRWCWWSTLWKFVIKML